MFERPHHQAIAKLLKCFDASVLSETNCFFGGGTAIVLLLNEYRESVDIDFLCASKSGFRQLRNIVGQSSLGDLLTQPVSYLRDVRSDLYGIRTFVELDGQPIKIEIVSEARIELDGCMDLKLGVPVLSRTDMYAEKLLANADRGFDQSVFNRDIIDLAMMIDAWGDIPPQTWKKVIEAYGDAVKNAFFKACDRVNDTRLLQSCLDQMKMDGKLVGNIQNAINSQLGQIKMEP
jgi:hypothetical protein